MTKINISEGELKSLIEKILKEENNGTQNVNAEPLKKISYEKLMSHNPELLGDVKNQEGQVVEFYENPINPENQVIAVIDGVAAKSGFYDLGDFYEDSEYNPILKDGQLYCYFELFLDY